MKEGPLRPQRAQIKIFGNDAPKECQPAGRRLTRWPWEIAPSISRRPWREWRHVAQSCSSHPHRGAPGPCQCLIDCRRIFGLLPQFLISSVCHLWPPRRIASVLFLLLVAPFLSLLLILPPHTPTDFVGKVPFLPRVTIPTFEIYLPTHCTDPDKSALVSFLTLLHLLFKRETTSPSFVGFIRSRATRFKHRRATSHHPTSSTHDPRHKDDIYIYIRTNAVIPPCS